MLTSLKFRIAIMSIQNKTRINDAHIREVNYDDKNDGDQSRMNVDNLSTKIDVSREDKMTELYNNLRTTQREKKPNQ